MNQKNDLLEYKRKYDFARHHAWAGSVILAIILAIRLFLEISDILINDLFVVIIGAVVVIYTLFAVVLTYKYRLGLLSEQQIFQMHNSSNNVEKERIKLDKKKVKAEVKKVKNSKE